MKIKGKDEIDQWEETEVTYYSKYEIEIEVEKGKKITVHATVVDECHLDHLELKGKKGKKLFDKYESKIRSLLDKYLFDDEELEDEEE
jgi:hypothetical protein